MFKKIDNILNIFIEEPEKRFSVREIARLLKINPSTASKYLQILAKDGFLRKRKEFNCILYQADAESEKFKDIKIYYNISKIRNSGLIEVIEDELYPEVIILFGSYAKGENTKRSDIDLFVLSESKKNLDVATFEKIFGSEIQLFVMNKKKVENIKKENKELLNNIMNGIRMSGFFEVFI
ncbi:MAG: nucleotidyltransferase domain-containing protein [Candidatus Aenigmarchaeota archaeon]|nr:nucleotidyltransferase domain-containing protein [Candidatus Aenigmarchaeota archaeon]